MSKVHVGIDLGTTNTVMATCKRPSRGLLIPDKRSIMQYLDEYHEGMRDSLPSVLFFDAEGNIKVGECALDKKQHGDMRHVLFNTKIDMGREVKYENNFTPVKAATEILKLCYKNILEDMAGRRGEFPTVTITVPASFDHSQIADTIKAAHAAGFEPDKLTILEEPVAALLYYINKQSYSEDEELVDFSEKKRVLVYDIGGGTCDVCVVDLQLGEDVSDYKFQFVATNRYTEFGGNDFDEQMAIGLLNKLFEKYEISDSQVSDEEKNYWIAKLIYRCEQYKIQYSQRLKNLYAQSGSMPDDVPDVVFGQLEEDFFGNPHVELEVTYKDFRKFTELFFSDNYRHLNRNLNDKMRRKNVFRPVYELLQLMQKRGEKNIDCVFLTGGMSEYLPIQKALEEFCNCPVIKTEKPMDSVALGASLYKFVNLNKNDAAAVAGKNFDETSGAEENFRLADDERPRLPEAIFIDVENNLPMKIIDANITIPCRGEVDHEFHVGASGVRFHLFAGQSIYDPEMRILYDYMKTFPRLVEPNTVAKIRYEVDEDRYLKLQLSLDDDYKQVFNLEEVNTSIETEK